VGYLKASKYVGVPQIAVERYVKQRRLLSTEKDCPTNKLVRHPVFPPHLEADLVQ
jgi:hypothetical protein